MCTAVSLSGRSGRLRGKVGLRSWQWQITSVHSRIANLADRELDWEECGCRRPSVTDRASTVIDFKELRSANGDRHRHGALGADSKLNREHSSATSRYPNGTRGYPVHTVKSVDSYPEAVDKMLKLCNLGMLTEF